ncbi:hypothetical protein Pmar_PMAR006814 [Perkinsus marinus ATCC 50983]|uniref:Uncharacterized protein n=1 Tax=Perkinsus marinus (strain ATCC 50983 / TXsc) TaxID=423536 RepID=C5K6K1_PERM5|nr:hypothetical protein Pmar_PMAR006814 [Perkinsus marinus ATCC 50983]EER19921.1 hypothetical protein Pmar_PMAR006814 [Perkinsus marinus ATCC 50983]|eukprot:XP_002788125.1 hypothetical protein Pmar_PMAR006814 [Perkinsus marinus ATCC 50983]
MTYTDANWAPPGVIFNSSSSSRRGPSSEHQTYSQSRPSQCDYMPPAYPPNGRSSHYQTSNRDAGRSQHYRPHYASDRIVPPPPPPPPMLQGREPPQVRSRAPFSGEAGYGLLRHPSPPEVPPPAVGMASFQPNGSQYSQWPTEVGGPLQSRKVKAITDPQHVFTTPPSPRLTHALLDDARRRKKSGRHTLIRTASRTAGGRQTNAVLKLSPPLTERSGPTAVVLTGDREGMSKDLIDAMLSLAKKARRRGAHVLCKRKDGEQVLCKPIDAPTVLPVLTIPEKSAGVIGSSCDMQQQQQYHHHYEGTQYYGYNPTAAYWSHPNTHPLSTVFLPDEHQDKATSSEWLQGSEVFDQLVVVPIYLVPFFS